MREILEKLRDILGDSKDIKSYCQEKFNKDHTVFLGYNRENPPQESEWPSIVIAGVELVEVKGFRKKYKIIVGFYVGSEETSASGNKVTFEGFILSEEFRSKCEDVVLSTKNFGKIQIESNTLDNLVFPLFTSITSFIIEFIR